MFNFEHNRSICENTISITLSGLSINWHRLIVPAVLLCTLAGCGPTRFEASNIYPNCGRAYEECPVNLSAYKSVQQRIGGQDPTLSLAVAISGGGYRAANFGAGALLELEQTTGLNLTQNNALLQIDYFSTVSGGGFAAAAYLSSLHDYLRFGGTYDNYSFAGALKKPDCSCPPEATAPAEQFADPCIRRHLRGFYSDAVGDLIQDIISWLTLDMFKNAGYFEKIIDDDILGYRWRKRKLRSLQNATEQSASLVLGDIFVQKDDQHRQVKLPYWVANATVYENGAIFAFTPDHLKLYKIRGYRHRLKVYEQSWSQPGYEKFIETMPLSVGATASASFPVATLPTTLTNDLDPNNRYLHLFDGGLADNIAVITAVRLLDAECSGEVTKKALIVVDAYRGTFAPFSSTKHPPPIGNTAMRVMNISLDSWRGRYRRIIRQLCEAKDIAVVFLSFDDLDELPDCQKLFEFGLDPNDVKALTGKAHSPQTPFELLRAIPTIKWQDKGKLSGPKQDLLLAAGRYVVHENKDDILNALKW